MIEKHVVRPVKSTFALSRCKRIDLEIYGIDHFRPSYTGLIFLNDTEVDETTASEDRPSYAGRFSVFAHELCYGDEGHCAVRRPRRFDTRRSHPLTKAFKRVTVTDTVREALSNTDELSITIIVSDGEKSDKTSGAKNNSKVSYDKLFSCEGLQLVAFA